ncbi:cytochrome P450 6k1-like [Pieris rapae]|uniref:cytochrome P450 6k1-like n=1 Tax=Pieris rapae TaxID=64459 RepID=UPI001E27D690|nr:cytochrome P450 6k1-like [Pieris rapae]
MIGVLISAIVVCCVSWVYLRWRRVKQYWADRGVPFLPPHPIWGSLTFLLKKNPGTWMIEMYQRFPKAPVIGIWLFWRPALIINSPELAKRILLKDNYIFRDRFLSGGSHDPIGSLNIFTTNDPLWTVVRRRISAIFTASKLRALQSLVDTKTSQLITRIKNTEDYSKLNLRKLFADYTTDVFGTAAFGVETEAVRTGEDPMRTITEAYMTFDWFRGLCWTSIFFFPELTKFFNLTLFPKWSTDYFEKVFAIVVAQRKDKVIKDPKDLVDALLKMKQDGPVIDGVEITDDVVISNAAAMLLGGFETSGSALTFTLYHLAYEPEIQQKIYEEVSKINAEYGKFEISTLLELSYLNAVVKETLRLYSPMGWLDRIPLQDYKFDENLTIKKGTPVYVNAIGMQYDHNYFPEPLKYDPERFMPGNEENIKPFTYLPFGDGPRRCVGMRFGLISVRHAISNLILRYKLEPIPGAPKPTEVELEKKGFFLVPGQHMAINFIPRDV